MSKWGLQTTCSQRSTPKRHRIDVKLHELVVLGSIWALISTIWTALAEKIITGLLMKEAFTIQYEWNNVRSWWLLFYFRNFKKFLGDDFLYKDLCTFRSFLSTLFSFVIFLDLDDVSRDLNAHKREIVLVEDHAGSNENCPQEIRGLH